MARSFKAFLCNQFWLIPVSLILGTICLIGMPHVAHAIGKGLVYAFFVLNAVCVLAVIPATIFTTGIARKDVMESALAVAFFGFFLLGGLCSAAFFFRIQGFEFLRWSEIDACAVGGSLVIQALLGALADYLIAYVLGGIALLFRRMIIGAARLCMR